MVAIGEELDDLATRLNQAEGVVQERDNLIAQAKAFKKERDELAVQVEGALSEQDGLAASFDRAKLEIEGLSKSKSDYASHLASLGNEQRELLIKLGAVEGMKIDVEKNLAKVKGLL